MNFNYRDFFANNDDTHIIKEQLSIVDEGVSKQDSIKGNAKAVWNMYQTEKDEQKIANKLGINLTPVQQIIKICLMKFVENKTTTEIANEMKLSITTIVNILNAATPDWERTHDINFINDALEIYNLHKQGKNPEEIVNLINQNRKPYLQIKLDKVNLVLKIVDIATKQMENNGVTNAYEIERQINGARDHMAIIRLIKKLGIGKIRHRHIFTPEQDAFILSCYLQRMNLPETSKQFSDKFSSYSNKLNLYDATIRRRIKDFILKSNSESEISEYALKLLTKYKNEYFSTVDINNDYTKELLTRYIPAEIVGVRDRLARKGGKVDPTRQISGQKGNLGPL
jgi:predicted transcriptional regulator